MSRLARFNNIVLDLDRLICACPSPDRRTGLVFTFEGMSERF